MVLRVHRAEVSLPTKLCESASAGLTLDNELQDDELHKSKIRSHHISRANYTRPSRVSRPEQEESSHALLVSGDEESSLTH